MNKKNNIKSKILCVLLTGLMVFSIPTVSFASSSSDSLKETSYKRLLTIDNNKVNNYLSLFRSMTTKPEIKVVANEITSTNHRYIKLNWERIEHANGYKIQISTDKNFKNCVVDRIKPSNANILKQSCSASISENVESAYYIRIKPVFDIEINDRYYRMYGVWSNTVVALVASNTVETLP